MPTLLARLGPFVEPGVREVYARHATTPARVSGQAAQLPTGTFAFLEGAEPPWNAAAVALPKPWPKELPAPGELWKLCSERRQERVLAPCSSWGGCTVDPRDAPCEIGEGRTGGLVRFVVNYAGWPFRDFPDETVEVLVAKMPEGEVWIVPPSSVPRPRSVPEAVHRREANGWAAAPLSPSPAVLASPPERTPPPQAPPAAHASPPPAPTIHTLPLRFQDLTFAEGRVMFNPGFELVEVPSEHAHEEYQDVRDLLDEALPDVLRLTYTRDGGRVTGIQLRGLERITDVFTVVARRHFIRTACAAEDWLDGDELAGTRPGGSGRRDPTELLDLSELGFDRRAEAFRRLLSARDPSERVRVLPGRSMLIPIAGRDGGPRWYAWETVLDDHATYLFRPASLEEQGQMFAWTRSRDSTRAQLLRDPALRAEVGFVRRVMHYDEGEDPLGAWWRNLIAVVLPA